jgi:hypothetical protein
MTDSAALRARDTGRWRRPIPLAILLAAACPAGQNLLNGRHLEFAATDYVQPSEMGRAVQLKVTWTR